MARCALTKGCRQAALKPLANCVDASRKLTGKPGVGEQGCHMGSPLEILIQSLQAIGGTHAHPMGLKQAKHREALGQVFLSPGGQLGVAHSS